MNDNKNRSTELLNKVYDHLEKVDISKLSMRELQDFLEVVQKGRFLETIGQSSPYGFHGFGGALTKPPVISEQENGNSGNSENK